MLNLLILLIIYYKIIKLVVLCYLLTKIINNHIILYLIVLYQLIKINNWHYILNNNAGYNLLILKYMGLISQCGYLIVLRLKIIKLIIGNSNQNKIILMFGKIT